MRQLTAVDFVEQAAAATPGSGFVRVYAKADGKLYAKDDAGTEYDLTATGSGGGAPKTTNVRVASTTNLTLSGTQTIDGVAVVAGDLVLAANQTTASENGIWTVAAGAWTRPTDFSTQASLYGVLVIPTAGTKHIAHGFVGYFNGAALTYTSLDNVGNTAAGDLLSAYGPGVGIGSAVGGVGGWGSVTNGNVVTFKQGSGGTQGVQEVINDNDFWWRTPAAGGASWNAWRKVLPQMPLVDLVATTNVPTTGAATIDGVAVVTGDYVLLTGQTTGTENGIWAVNTAGAWTKDYQWFRYNRGLHIFVKNGTSHAKSIWVVTSADGQMGTDATVYEKWTGAGSGGGGADAWAGKLHTFWGDGNPNQQDVLWAFQNSAVSVAAPSATGISTTIGRLVSFRYDTAITVNRIRWFQLLALPASTFSVAIYRDSDNARLWTLDLPVGAAGWNSALLSPAVTFAADTLYWFGISAKLTGTTLPWRSTVSPIANSVGLATMPGNLSPYMTRFAQVALAAGVWPATLPAKAAAAFASAGTTGTVPIFFADNNNAA